MADTERLAVVADQLAIIDLFNRYCDDVEAKRFDRIGAFYADDAEVRWPDRSVSGSDVVKAMRGTRSELPADEVRVYHNFGSFSPVVDGDTAVARIRVRGIHYGIGPRAGRFEDSFGVQEIRFVRTPDGWRCSFYEWQRWGTQSNIASVAQVDLA